MRDSAKANVCVYFLRDPRDMTPRYVGITCSPRQRLQVHLETRTHNAEHYDSDHGTRKRILWLRELHSLGLRPILDPVLAGLTREQALRAESYLSKKAAQQFPGKFYQKTVGLADPLDAIKTAWAKCNEKQRQLAFCFISQQLQPT